MIALITGKEAAPQVYEGRGGEGSRLGGVFHKLRCVFVVSRCKFSSSLRPTSPHSFSPYLLLILYLSPFSPSLLLSYGLLLLFLLFNLPPPTPPLLILLLLPFFSRLEGGMGGEEPSTLLSLCLLSSRYYNSSVATRTASFGLVGLLLFVLPLYSFILLYSSSSSPSSSSSISFLFSCPDLSVH